jgi:hypothetical protein
MTTAVVTTPPAAADLVLTRLAVPSKRPPSAAEAREDVEKVLGEPIPADEFASITEQLLSEGLVERRPRSKGGVQLTPAGRERALTLLGVAELPPRTNWAAVRAKYLFRKALKVTPAEAEKLDSADRLAALLLRREYDLPAGTTFTAALEAVVCSQLGRTERSFAELSQAVLSAFLGSDERLAKRDVVKQFPRKLIGSKSGKLDDLRQAVVRKWLRESTAGANGSPAVGRTPAFPAEMPFDLTAFAATVKRLARDCPAQARFGTNKVFIAAAWCESQAEDGFPRMPLAEFKGHLVEANRAGLLKLEPADLVQAMDPGLVAESRTEQAGASLHFILIEEVLP